MICSVFKVYETISMNYFKGYRCRYCFNILISIYWHIILVRFPCIKSQNKKSSSQAPFNWLRNAAIFIYQFHRSNKVSLWKWWNESKFSAKLHLKAILAQIALSKQKSETMETQFLFWCSKDTSLLSICYVCTVHLNYSENVWIFHFVFIFLFDSSN